MAKCIRSVETDSIVSYNGQTLTYYPKNGGKLAYLDGKLVEIEGGLVTMECEDVFIPGDFVYHTRYKLYGIIKKIEPLCNNRYRVRFVVSDVETRKYMIKDDYCDADSLTDFRFMTDDEKRAFINKLNGHYYNYVFTDNKIHRRGVPTTGEYVKLVKWGTMDEIYCISGIGSNMCDTEYTPICFMESNSRGVWNVNTKPLLPFKFADYIVMPCSIQEIEMMNRVLSDANYIFYKSHLRLFELPERVCPGETYWYISDRGFVEATTEDYTIEDKARYEIGNYFPNPVVAEDYANKVVQTLLGSIDDRFE